MNQTGKRARVQPVRAPFRCAALAVLATCQLACGGTAQPEEDAAARSPSPVLVSVPVPNLETADDAARDQLENLRAAIEVAATQTPRDDQALADAYGSLGSAYIVYELMEAGDAALRNATTLAPDDFRWHYLAAYSAQLQGRVDEAIRGYGDVLAREAFPPAYIRRARAHLERGALEDAEADFRVVLTPTVGESDDATQAAVFEGLGRIADARGDTATAIRNLEQARDLAPEATSLDYVLGQLYRKQGDLERARRLLADRGDVPVRIPDPLVSALGTLGRTAQLYVMQAAEAMDDRNFEAAAAAYQRALDVDDTSFTAYRGLATAVERLGDLDAAIGHVTRGLERGRDDDGASEQRERAELARMLGSMQVLAGRDADAIDAFRRAIDLDAARDDARLLLANALARAGRFADALDVMDAMAPEAQTGSAAILVKRAMLLVNLRRGDEAVATFERALAAQPDDPAVRLRFAEALTFLGRDARAIRERETAERLASNTPGNDASAPAATGSLDATARLLLEDARTLIAKGDLENAVTRFDQLLEHAPDQVGVRFELAQLLGHLGYLDDATREFRTVVEAAPDHAGARRGEITVLLLTARFGMARLRLQEALKRFPLDAGLAHVQARLLATSPDPDVRDGALALELVRRLMKVRTDGPVQETHAMALAAVGQYADAAQVIRDLVIAAEDAGQTSRAAALRRRQEHFESGQIWAARSGEEIVAATFGAAGSQTADRDAGP